MKKIIFIFALLTLFSGRGFAQDSIPDKSKQLDELVVVGDRAWIEDGIVKAIPSKKEKKLSNSPASLIRMMHLPYLIEKDGAIVTGAGEPVAIFINGVKCDDIDLSTFWPKEVKQVEYVENSPDPKYEGNQRVVNFIMDKYEWGGVTKTDLLQQIPNSGTYTAASKFAYKKMVYGMQLRGRYSRDHSMTASDETVYKDLYYNGKHYDRIVRQEDSHSYERNDELSASFNARYTTNRMRLIHTVALGWKHDPGSGSAGANQWSDNLFGSLSSASERSSRQLSPQISGDYYFVLSDKWYLPLTWGYSYSSGKASSWNQIGDNAPVTNDTKEKVNSTRVSLQPAYVLNNKITFQLKLNGSFDWFSTKYTGSANTRETQKRQEITASLLMYWAPKRSLIFSLSPGMLASMWQIGSVKQHELTPTINAMVYLTPTRKFTESLSAEFFKRPPSAAQSNPVLTKESDLVWALGNPYLKSRSSWAFISNSTYRPTNWLSIGLTLDYTRSINNILTTYAPADKEQGGLIRKLINGVAENSEYVSLRLGGSFFDNNLNINVAPRWRNFHCGGEYKTSFSRFSFDGDADYTIGDFNFGIGYRTSDHDKTKGGMEESWWSGYWNVFLTYGTGNLYVNLGVDNIFNSKSKMWEKYNSPYFTTYSRQWSTGRMARVNITYTFGYGKKVSRNIEISGPEATKTSILSADR